MQDRDELDDLLEALDKAFETARAEMNQNFDKAAETIKKAGREAMKERDEIVVSLMNTLKSDLEHQVSLLRSMKASNTSVTDYSSLFIAAENLQKLCLDVFVALNEKKYSKMPIDEIEQSIMDFKERITTTINTKADYHRNRYFSTTGKSLSILNELTNTVNRIQGHVINIQNDYLKKQSHPIADDTRMEPPRK